jgi:fatty-acyl-CoA synthase
MKEPLKVSYLSVPGDHPLLPHTIPQLIEIAVEKYGDSQALIVSDLNIRKTFRQLKEEVPNLTYSQRIFLKHLINVIVQIDDLARGLLSLGLSKGDRIGIWAPNSYEFYVTQMAAWTAGLILVNSVIKGNPQNT